MNINKAKRFISILIAGILVFTMDAGVFAQRYSFAADAASEQKPGAQATAATQATTGSQDSAATQASTGSQESAAAPATSAEVPASADDYVSDELLVVFDDDVKRSKVKSTLSEHDAKLEALSSLAGLSSSGDEKLAVAKLDEKMSSRDMVTLMEEIGSEKNVSYVQPNYRYHIAEKDPNLNDEDQYQFAATTGEVKGSNITKAWELMEKNGIRATTKVAVIDTGVDVSHEDLQANLEGSSYKRYCHEKATDETEDSGDHGTHVAGLIGATYGNGKGGAGVASGPKNNYSSVLVVGSSGDGYSLTTFDVILGIKYAASQGAKIINLSLGGSCRDRLLGAEIKDKYYNNDIVFVAAAGNFGLSVETDYDSDPSFMHFPSDMKEVISVCNIGSGGLINSGSCVGFAKDISAPGTNVLSTLPENEYGKKTGTSMSTPIVSGVCALLLDIDPTLKPAEIRNIICGTSYNNKYCRAEKIGHGALDAYAAVSSAYQKRDSDIKPTGISISTYSKDSKSLTLYTEKVAAEFSGDTGFGLDTLLEPANAEGEITWKSSNASVASVDSKGFVTGNRAGTCSITASVETGSGTKSDSIQVIVKNEVPVVRVDIGFDTMKLYVEDIYFGLAPYLYGPGGTRDVTNGEIYYKSSDPSVAYVDDYGIIYMLKPGKCTITATARNGVSDTLQVTVAQSKADDNGGYWHLISNCSWVKLTKVKSPSAKAKKKKIIFTFRKASATKSIMQEKIWIDNNTGMEVGDIVQSETSKKISVSSYQIAIRKSTSKKWSRFTVPAKKRSTSKYQVRVKSGKIQVTIKKAGNKKLKSRARYFVKVRPLKKYDSRTYYGDWSKIKKVKVK